MASFRSCLLLSLMLLPWCRGEAQEPAWERKVHRITEEEYVATLQYWAREYPRWVTLEQVGVSVKQRPLYLLRITDQSVPGDDKQHALVTALHGGPERSGTTTALHLIEWLLSDDALATDVRRRQQVLVMPVNNPDSFFVTDRFGNANGIDPYTGSGHWDLEGPRFTEPDKAPEVMAVLRVVDRFKPEVHIDLHGTGLQEYPDELLGDRRRYVGQTMFEVTGSSYSNHSLRPWDWRVTEAMIDAGEAAGFGSDRFEADAQRLFWGPQLAGIRPKLWSGVPRFYTAHYGYSRYHSMPAALEIGWEASGVARTQGLLRLGNARQPGRLGYPVNRVAAYLGNFVTSCGASDAERRASRVAIWNRQPHFSFGVLYPQTDGRATFFCATSPVAGRRLQEKPQAFLNALKGLDQIDFGAVRRFVETGPEVQLAVKPADETADPPPLNTGIGFQLRIPYRNPELRSVRLNGRPLAEFDEDSNQGGVALGYRSWFADAFTYLQIEVPADVAAENDLFLVTCSYTPDRVRTYGWEPPAEVREKLREEQ